MADDGGAWGEILRSGEVCLAVASRPPSHLWAQCRCGRRAMVNPGPWIAQGLGRQAVETLEDRLRCLCGARRARLEIREEAETPGGGGIYVFR
jgi:hypothetical protein